MRTILVTGGAGFIGSHLVRYLLQQPGVRVVNLDALTYAGELQRLSELEGEPRYVFVHGRIEDEELVAQVCRRYEVEGIINCAAQTHVDRSILRADAFVETNVRGTYALLQVARQQRLRRFLQLSTDEVYGEASEGSRYAEDSPLQPSSPYAATKAAADHLVSAFVRTYGVPAFIVRSCNVYGPYQFPEKLIPMSICNALCDDPIPLYGDGLQRREWLYVEDLCRALWLLYERAEPGRVYNVSSQEEWSNLEVVQAILQLLGKPQELIRPVPDRPGHDRRYAMESQRVAALGWRAEVPFAEGLQRTVRWYIEHRPWWERLRAAEYAQYRRQWYEGYLHSGQR
jgi:dTDP-glucose 4,6-dehydratase